MHRYCAVAVLLIAACQPRERRLLLVDLNLTDPALLEATAAPWDAAGYSVDYRRFYPHLTRQDLQRHRVVVLLGGRTPEAMSDALDLSDLALLAEWLPRGGVLVFGYAADGEGFQDRWVMNRWLASQGVGITIGDYPLEDTAASRLTVAPVPNRALRSNEPDPFPPGRAHVLLIDDPQEAFARASGTAFVRAAGRKPAPRRHAAVVAAERVGEGLVVIASRHTLGALGPDYRSPAPGAVTADAAALIRTRQFLVALARWTLRPAEWALLPAARRRAPLSLEGAPRPILLRRPRAASPPGATTVRLPTPSPADTASPGGLPTWLRRTGTRGLWARDFALPALDSLVAFLETGAFNTLVSGADPGAADSLVRRRATTRYWPAVRLRLLIDRVQQTSLHWVPALEWRQLHPPRESREWGAAAGDSLPGWCSLDGRLWDEELAPAFLSLARLAASDAELIPAVALDLTPEGAEGEGWKGEGQMATGFCDSTYAAGVRALGQDSALTARLSGLPLEARYRALADSGALEAYYSALEAAVAARAAALSASVRRVRSDVLFVVRTTALPSDWFTLGLLRGLATNDAPVLLWTREPRTRAVLARYRARGLAVLPAVGVPPPTGGAPAREWARLKAVAFGENDGFWITAEDARGGGRVSADSLARLLRRLAKDR
jgi:hypothetical protein